MLILTFSLLVAQQSPMTAPHPCADRYAAGSMALATADKQIGKRRFAAAKQTLDLALDRLGFVPVSATTADDSGLNLLYADDLAKRGLMKAAVTTKRRILAGRLERCIR